MFAIRRVHVEAYSVWTRAVLLSIPLMLVAGPATSQSFYGSLISVSQDAQGGVIPGATVVLTNTATTERREGVSAEDGTARFVNLVPGTYRLEVELAGFQRFVRDGIAVNIQTTPRIEATLQLGSLQETVSVTGESPLLQTENASVGTVVGARAVQELPLNGRNVLNLISVAPSVVPQGGSEGSLTGKNVFAAGNYQIGGGIANQSASLFDGVPVQDMAYGNIVVLTPSPEAVEEFRVQTNNSSAEFGRFTGGVVNIASRSGSNAFRGSLFEYHRNKALNSNTFFGERAGLDKPPFVQNNFGGVLGGPVLRNKLFFFSSYEGYRNREGVLFRRTVPTAAMKAETSPTTATWPLAPWCLSTIRGRSAASTIPAPVVTTATAARCRIVCSSPATSFRPIGSAPSRDDIWTFLCTMSRPSRAGGGPRTGKKMPQSAATTIR